MKTKLLLIIVMFLIPLVIPQSFAQCIANDDWDRAPCLDVIMNGWYIQEDVDRWSEYYSYKGSIFMEDKYLELNESIKEDNLQQWVDESMINRNVYEYYFFSGRAPNTGEYHAWFNVISVNEENVSEYGKQHYVNLVPFDMHDGISNLILIVFGIIGIGITVAVLLRKRK